MIRTQAWLLRAPVIAGDRPSLEQEELRFPPPRADEALVRPLYGCWEGNMCHALRGSPLDLCKVRGEPLIVLGNAGVVEVVETNEDADLRAGDRCLVFCNGEADPYGYPSLIYGYDAPGTIGIMAKLSKLKVGQLIKLPAKSALTLPQWAAFSLRYITAWANWRVAVGCWGVQMPEHPAELSPVLGWGGGVSLAELSLARIAGHPAGMVASSPTRLALIERLGIAPIDRRSLSLERFEDDFLSAVKGITSGRGAAIFVDNIGAHYRTTLKALSRQGVLTTSGWKNGLTFPTVRASECIERHIHVFTHYARRSEGEAAAAFAEENNWHPPQPSKIWAWDEIPILAKAYECGMIDDYFPIYSISSP